MLYSRALRFVGLIAIALASVSCGEITGPTSPNVTEPSMLAPPTDAAFTRWILISGVWIEVDDLIVK